MDEGVSLFGMTYIPASVPPSPSQPVSPLQTTRPTFLKNPVIHCVKWYVKVLVHGCGDVDEQQQFPSYKTLYN